MAPPVIVLLGPSGLAAAQKIRAALPDCRLDGPCERFPDGMLAVTYDDLVQHLGELFREGHPIVALCASGIVIRALAPWLTDKRTEPPVVAVAQDGSVAVPLLGGHHGANRLACEIAEALGGQAAITTAGDLRFDLALDEPPPGWVTPDPAAAKPIMSALLDGRPVALEVEAGDPSWLTAGGARFAESSDLEILVTDRDVAGSPQRLVIHPKVLALGVGCERGASPGELIELAIATLADHGLAAEALACVASIELKAAEPAIHALAEHFDLPVRFLPAETLEAEADRLANPSPVVFAATGCHGVAEGAALAAVGAAGGLVVEKTKSAHATCAVARAHAPLDPDQVGRPRGHLAIVGFGPGADVWRTPEANALLRQASAWVGYHGYLDLIEPLRVANTECHPFALGEEETRARCALDLAAAGRRVALVSSGDAGIYAMAALVFELLDRTDQPAWQRIAVSVSPGISALQAAAARAGAPLGHDFCAISL